MFTTNRKTYQLRARCHGCPGGVQTPPPPPPPPLEPIPVSFPFGTQASSVEVFDFRGPGQPNLGNASGRLNATHVFGRQSWFLGELFISNVPFIYEYRGVSRTFPAGVVTVFEEQHRTAGFTTFTIRPTSGEFAPGSRILNVQVGRHGSQVVRNDLLVTIVPQLFSTGFPSGGRIPFNAPISSPAIQLPIFNMLVPSQVTVNGVTSHCPVGTFIMPMLPFRSGINDVTVVPDSGIHAQFTLFLGSEVPIPITL